jgi:hypothetical protein
MNVDQKIERNNQQINVLGFQMHIVAHFDEIVLPSISL